MRAGARKGPGGSPQADLLKWCQKMTEGYPGVNITNFHVSWRDGLGFCALVDKYAPNSLSFASLNSKNILENNQLAFDTAFSALNVPKLLDAEDMLLETPERFSIMTYLLQFFRTVADKGPPLATGAATSPSQPVAKPSSPPPTSGSVTQPPTQPKATTLGPQKPQTPTTQPAPANPPPASNSKPYGTVFSPSQLLRAQREKAVAQPTGPTATPNRSIFKSSSSVRGLPPKAPVVVAEPAKPELSKTDTSKPAASAEEEEEEELGTDSNDIGMVTALKHLMRCYLRQQDEGIIDEDGFKAASKEVDDAHNLFQKSGRRSASTIEVEEDRSLLLQAFDDCQRNFQELKTMIAAKHPTEEVQIAAFELNDGIDDILTFIFGDNITPEEEDFATEEIEMAEQLAEALDVIEQLDAKIEECTNEIAQLQSQVTAQKKELEELRKTSHPTDAPVAALVPPAEDALAGDLKLADLGNILLSPVTIPKFGLSPVAPDSTKDALLELQKKYDEMKADYEKRLEIANKAIMTSNEYFGELTEEISEAKKKQAESNAAHAKEIEEIKKKHAEEKEKAEGPSESTDEVKKLQEERDKLKLEVENLKKALMDTNDYFTELQSELTETKKKLHEKTGDSKGMQELQLKVTEMEQENEELKKGKEELTNDYERRLESATATINSSNEYFAELKSEVDDAKKKQIDSEVELESVKKLLQDSINKQADSQVEIDELKAKLKVHNTTESSADASDGESQKSPQFQLLLDEANQTIALLEEERLLLDEDLAKKSSALEKLEAKIAAIANALAS